MRLLSLGVAACFLLVPSPLRSELTFLGPIPYRSLADSPCFDAGNSGRFFVEDFEDGAQSFPAGAGGFAVNIHMPGLTTDSVDADDGVIDGFGRQGHSATPVVVFAAPTLPTTWQTPYDIGFNPQVLGYLPECAGIVVTDGLPQSWLNLTVFDGDNVGSSLLFLDSLFDDLNMGDTNDDWFFGVKSTNGITRIGVSHTYQDFFYEPRFEVDHAQFSGQIPEPELWNGVWAAILVAILTGRRRNVPV